MGFFAETVAAQQQLAALEIINRHGPCAVEFFKTGFAPKTVGCEQNFGVGVRAKGDAVRGQLAFHFLIVVDESVENAADRELRVIVRLMAGRAEIDDRKAAMPEREIKRLAVQILNCNGAIAPRRNGIFAGRVAIVIRTRVEEHVTLIIRSAMANGVGHPLNRVGQSRPRAVEIEHSGNSAHRTSLLVKGESGRILRRSSRRHSNKIFLL